MFGSGNKSKQNLVAPRLSFVERLIDRAMEIPNVDVRLSSLVGIWSQIRELEDEYEERCNELEFLRDPIADAFRKCTSADFAVVHAFTVPDLIPDEILSFKDDPEYKALSPLLKLRLVKLRIGSHFDGLELHASEYLPSLQHVFCALEERDATDAEIAATLEREHGVRGWKSRYELNRGVIYESPSFPLKRK